MLGSCVEMSDSRRDTHDPPTLVGELPVIGAVRRGAKPFVLQQIEGPGAPRQFVLDLDEVVLGRSQQAHICIESSRLSRRHALLKKRDGEYSVVDLESANGVYLNGVRAHSAVLREGDAMQIGDVVFVYHEGT